jgi:glycosyltransferase involved in cell wall biosynthesis
VLDTPPAKPFRAPGEEHPAVSIFRSVLKAAPANEREKIAICLEYPIKLQGGVSVLCEILVRELASHYRIVLVSDDSPEDIAHSGLAPLIETHLRWNPVENTPQRAREFAEQLTATGVRLAHFHLGGTFGWGAPRLHKAPVPMVARKGIRVVSTAHLVIDLFNGYCDLQKPFWFKLAFFPAAWLAKLYVMSHTVTEIAVSQWGRDRLRRWYWPLAGRFTHIYHSKLRAEELPPLPSERDKTILYVGHVARRKGQLVLARAFAQICAEFPDWKLHLAGHDGGDGVLDEIHRLIQERGLSERILYLGQRTDSIEMMLRAGIFVQPSYFEGLPLALQEAMLCGCACVATDIPGNNEIISHESNGLLVPKGNSAAMAAALECLIRDEALLATFQKRARTSVLTQGMSAGQMVKMHLELYRQALAT